MSQLHSEKIFSFQYHFVQSFNFHIDIAFDIIYYNIDIKTENALKYKMNTECRIYHVNFILFLFYFNFDEINGE